MARKSKHKKVNDSFVMAENSTSKLLVAVSARNAGQKKALKAIADNQVTFLYGAPGTGKTHCAVGYGIQEMLKGTYERVIFTRPYVEAGEKLGFLPGGFDSKFAPFVMPLYEVVSDYLSQDEIKAMIEDKRIIVYPLAYMRGATFKKSFIVADEVQNSTMQQMRMMLTRIGEGTKIVCTGDVEQSDLGSRVNGLADAIERLPGVENLEFVELGYDSCVREKIVSDIDRRYKSKPFLSADDLAKIQEENLKNNGKYRSNAEEALGDNEGDDSN